ncbi:hypothetical protein KKG52_03340 [Patescibacteria group bacterium]|nr:hypothetical protein [Patescibacteria group bacterium]
MELAVMLRDLLFEPENLGDFDKKYLWAVEKYKEAGVQLTDQEIEALPLFIRLSHSMNIIGSSSIDTDQYISQSENNYWMQLGRKGLKFTMEDWQQ